MSILWADGFDHYGVSPNGGRDAMLAGAWAAFSTQNTLPVIDAVHARTGTYALHLHCNHLSFNNSVFARRVITPAQSLLDWATGLYFPSLPPVNNQTFMEFRNNANNCIVRIAIESDGAIGVYTGTARTYLSSSDPVFTPGAWNHLETKIVADSIVGEIEVRLNGIPVFYANNLNLGNLGVTQVTYQIDWISGVGVAVEYWIDDIVMSNGDFLGAQRVHTIFPVSDTAEADWVKVGDADGFDCIDNVPPDGDSTYLVADNAGDVSEFGIGTLPPETQNITGVYIPVMAKLDDAGTGNIQVSLISAGDVSAGPDQVLTTAYTYWGGTHMVDPDTSGPWTKSALEAALLRVEKTV